MIEEIGEPFAPIPIDPSKHSHLSDLTFTEKYPVHTDRPFQFLLSEPHYSQIMLSHQRVLKDPSVPSAKASKLGWFLRGATGLKNRLHSFTIYNDDALTFETSQIYRQNTENFNFGLLWSSENVGINPNESDEKELTFDQLKAEEKQKSSAVFNKKSGCWGCEFLWKDSDPDSRYLTNNYNRALALLK
jgi:hypothetical protein